MKTSEQLNELGAALSAAQGMFLPINKGRSGHFGRYATLAATLDAIRPGLVAHGLAVVQPVELHAGPDPGAQTVTVTTVIVHTSGQWMSSDLALPVSEQTEQAVGKAITYGRRYALAAMVGVAAHDEPDVDDDAPRQLRARSPHVPVPDINRPPLVDLATGEVLTEGPPPPPPAGAHYLERFELEGGWYHVWVDGQHLKTKSRADLGELASQAWDAGLPVRYEAGAEIKGARDGARWLNDLEMVTALPLAPVPPPEPISDDDIPF